MISNTNESRRTRQDMEPDRCYRQVWKVAIAIVRTATRRGTLRRDKDQTVDAILRFNSIETKKAPLQDEISETTKTTIRTIDKYDKGGGSNKQQTCWKFEI